MKWKTLLKIADKGTVQPSLANDTGIVSVSFEYKGCLIGAQYDSDNGGLYAFDITDPDKFFDVMDHGQPEAEQT